LPFGEAGASIPLVVTDTDATVLTSTRLVVATLPAIVFGVVQLNLPAEYPAGVQLVVIRTDANSGTVFLIQPELPSQINGTTDFAMASTDNKNGPSGLALVFDGTNWWSVAETPTVP